VGYFLLVAMGAGIAGFAGCFITSATTFLTRLKTKRAMLLGIAIGIQSAALLSVFQYYCTNSRRWAPLILAVASVPTCGLAVLLSREKNAQQVG
jgi:ABC-type Fe3+-siderophore transport system permease subunit